MAKLYFRYGAVSSAKTMNLLAAAHSYQAQERKVLLVKPALDKRFGAEVIQSRTGLHKKADFLVGDQHSIPEEMLKTVDCILVDEVQFLKPSFIEHLRILSIEENIPVICYGLRTDFRGELFEGSKRLLELADAIEEIKTQCVFCNRKAIFNMKLKNGAPTVEGPVIDLGTEEKYLPTCAGHFHQKTSGIASIPMEASGHAQLN
jgi:thymidine kinase